eukprot:COSAG02_NODE_513_length_20826_cov_323.015246_5_plen_277_part_00
MAKKQKQKGKGRKKELKSKPRRPSMYTKQIVSRKQPNFRQNQQAIISELGSKAFGFPGFYGALTNNAMNAFQNQRYGLETQIRELRAEANVIGQAGGNVDAMLQQIRAYEGELANLGNALRDIGGGLTNTQRQQALMEARLRDHDDILRRGGGGGARGPPPIPGTVTRVSPPRSSARQTSRARTPTTGRPASNRSAASSVARALRFEGNRLFDDARASAYNPMEAVLSLAQRGPFSTGTRQARAEARREREVNQGNALGYYDPDSPYLSRQRAGGD